MSTSRGGAAQEVPFLMLDFNHRPSTARGGINALVDASPHRPKREATPPRTYSGASRLVMLANAALQFDVRRCGPRG